MRLHVSPLTPDLLPILAGPSLLPSVSNVSFHEIQTFPEKSFGYMDMPLAEAEKMKKKLNGAIVKGKKVKIEEARPKKMRRVEELADGAAEPSRPTRPKQATSDRHTLPGHTLAADRKVKRGWTEAAAKTTNRPSATAASTSKFSDHDELLFRTKVPPNRKEVSGMRREDNTRGKKRKATDVVHEFAKSFSEPTFLKQDQSGPGEGPLEYVDGTGWVNEAGQVVEAESARSRRNREGGRASAATRQEERPAADASEDTSASSDGGDDDDDDDDDDAGGDGDDGDAARDLAKGSGKTKEIHANDGKPAPESAKSTTCDDVDQRNDSPPDAAAKANEGLHPLEALFKKPTKPASHDVAKPSLEVSTSFSFFDSSNLNGIVDEYSVPLTPFSSQDLRARGLRSAAPTPDTAFPSRFNSDGSPDLSGDDVSDREGEGGHVRNPGAATSSPSQAKERKPLESSDFEKKFWERRAENNRTWKLRRRTVLKEKRQRENRARRPKNW